MQTNPLKLSFNEIEPRKLLAVSLCSTWSTSSAYDNVFEWLAYAELCATTALLLALHKVASFNLAQIPLWEQQQL